MFRSVVVFFVLIVLWGCSAPAPTRSATAPLPTATAAPATPARPTPTRVLTKVPLPDAATLAARLDEYFTKLSASGTFSGVVFIARDGEVIFEKAFGASKKPPQAPLTPATKFRIASVTKQFTAAAILHLQAQGKLNVQDKVCEYLETCPKSWQDITLHHLLTNTSGLTDNYYFDLSQPRTLSEIVAILQKAPLRAESGGAYFHNTFGFVLLAHLVERVSGKGYEEYLRETYFEPLGMHNTGSAIADSELPGYAVKVDYSNLMGGADLYSTAQDLYLWTQALDKWQQDPGSEYQPMFQPHVPLPESGFSYGYGLAVAETLNHHWVGHPGNGVGAYASLVGRYSDIGTSVIVLGNNGYNTATDIQFFKLLLGQE